VWDDKYDNCPEVVYAENPHPYKSLTHWVAYVGDHEYMIPGKEAMLRLGHVWIWKRGTSKIYEHPTLGNSLRVKDPTYEMYYKWQAWRQLDHSRIQ